MPGNESDDGKFIYIRKFVCRIEIEQSNIHNVFLACTSFYRMLR